MIGRAVSALIKRILRQSKGVSNIPHKSPSMPGVASKNLAGYADRPSPLIREIEKRYSGAKPNLPGVKSHPLSMERRPGIEDLRAREAMNLRWKRPKSAVMGSISRMRRDPGIGAGLGRLESRKASALSSGGRGAMGAGRSVKPAKALQYEPSTKRSFTSMLRADKNFEEFVVDSVGAENVSKVMNNSKIRKQLMLAYERMGAKGHPRTLGEFNEMDVGMSNPYSLSQDKIIGEAVKEKYWDLF